MSSEDFSQTVALITGSGGGLGKEFALRLLKGGAHVCLSDVNPQLGNQTMAEFKEEFGDLKVHFVQCDVASKEDWKRLWNEANAHFGSLKVNLLVNNAGVMGEKEGWEKCIDINLFGVLYGATLALEEMQEGTIVNVASILGLFCAKQPKGWAYNVSKSAVVNATRCMSSAKPNIRIMCLCPSVTKTPILDGCTQKELEDMRQQVGGFMSIPEVGKAFTTLLESGSSGNVMSLWVDSPPYLIPDTSMFQFIMITACAMAFRFLPRPRVVKPFPHVLLCFVVFPIFVAAGMFFIIKTVFP